MKSIPPIQLRTDYLLAFGLHFQNPDRVLLIIPILLPPTLQELLRTLELVPPVAVRPESDGHRALDLRVVGEDNHVGSGSQGRDLADELDAVSGDEDELAVELES